MSKCFHIYEYDDNLKERLDTYQLQGKAILWWEEVNVIHAFDEEGVNLGDFQKYFKEKYFIEHFYDNKVKEFHDLWLRKLSLDEFMTKFTSLPRYVPYIHEDKAKV